MRPGAKKTQQQQPSMGCCGLLMWLLKWGMIVFGVLFLMLYCGVFTRMGAFKWLDSRPNEDGNLNFRGIAPFVHYGDPWEFGLDELKSGELNGKVIIVTGANTGLGFASSVALASKGAEVVMGCRSKERCGKAVASLREKVKGVKGAGEAVPMSLDLASFESVRKFAEEFEGKYERLDSLMLNAGIMWVPFGKTEQGIESQIGVNHFGHFYLTSLLLPLLRKTATPTHPATIVSVSSAAHFRTYPHGISLTLEELNDEKEYDKQHAYGQSKLANVLFAFELAKREQERDSNVLVNVIHPGVVDTELTRYFLEGAQEALGPASFIAEPLLNALSKSIFWDCETASLTQVYTSVGPKILEEKITGKYYHPIARETPPHVKFAHSEKLQKGLWALSEAVVKKFEGKK